MKFAKSLPAKAVARAQVPIKIMSLRMLKLRLIKINEIKDKTTKEAPRMLKLLSTIHCLWSEVRKFACLPPCISMK